MYKLLCIDLDETSLNSNDEISKENEEAIRQCEKKGVKVIFTTGRTPFIAKKYIKQLELFNRKHVFLNGGMLYEYGKEPELLVKFSKEDLDFILDLEEKRDSEAVMYTSTGLYHNKEEIPHLGIPMRRYHNLVLPGKLNSDMETCRVCFYYEDENDLKTIIEKLPPHMEATYWNHICDIMPKGITKYYGLKYILKEDNIPLDQVIAVGEQHSDKDILEKVGLGIAVKNCDEHARRAADIILDVTNNQHAIKEVIYKYILN